MLSRLQRLQEMVAEADSVSPEQYKKVKPKVLQHLQSAADWVGKNTRTIQGGDSPRDAFGAAGNLVFAAEMIAKALGDAAAVRKLKAAAEALRKSAVQWPED